MRGRFTAASIPVLGVQPPKVQWIVIGVGMVLDYIPTPAFYLIHRVDVGQKIWLLLVTLKFPGMIASLLGQARKPAQ